MAEPQVATPPDPPRPPPPAAPDRPRRLPAVLRYAIVAAMGAAIAMLASYLLRTIGL